MRLIPSLLVPAFCWQLAAASIPTADVYLYDPNQPQQPRPDRTLSPVAARLVLAQRVGAEDFHSADLYDSDVIAAINDYGVRTPLFSQQPGGEDALKRALILVDEMSREDAATYASWTQIADFKISPLPSLSSTRELFEDLMVQVGAGTTRVDIARGMSLGDAKEQLRAYMEEGDVAVTVFILPSVSTSDEDENAGTADWGTYSMPNSESQLRKRQEQKEEPLEVTPDASFSPIESSTSLLTNQADNSSPLPGILPACYTSLSSCNEITRNCTGHGSCSLKYTDPDQDPPKACYSCQCSPTKHETSDGKTQTTYWGGPACQKRDISMQFWLISLFVVAMAGLVSFAVGSVWSMGEEELPSVIGAGVSGPVARR